MAKLLKVWCLNGRDDDDEWEEEIFSTYEKAKKAFDDYVDEINSCYGEYNEDEDEYESVCEIEDNRARYDCGSHYGTFWISEVTVR